MNRMIGIIAIVASLLIAPTMASELETVARIEQAMFGQHRSEANIARNRYRHPVGTLSFFGLEDGMTVMEIWPGGGWYAEILAPVVRDHGQYIIAGYDVEVPDQPDYRYRLQKSILEKFTARPGLYDQVRVQPFSPPLSGNLGDENSIDLILTFRNAHGWVGDGVAEQIFTEFARVLKPGGRLGIVQHRAPDGADPKVSAELGYLSEAAIIGLADAAGLRLKKKSELNANPKDSRDYPEGVWTLPPSLALEEIDRDKYLAIGESDRMTLLFVKPAN
jgi:predicted methyltransferase